MGFIMPTQGARIVFTLAPAAAMPLASHRHAPPRTPGSTGRLRELSPDIVGVAGLCDQSPVQQFMIVAPTLIATFPRLDGGSPNRAGSPETSTRRTL